MRQVMLVVLLVAVVGLTGCKKRPRHDVAAAPGPMDFETMPAPPPPYPVGPPQAGVGPQPLPEPVPVAPEPTVFEPAPAPRTYVVQRGDTLTGIARRLYGDPARWRDIHQANPQIANPNQIRVGQTLNLP